MTLYSIAGWETHFEIYDARRVEGPLKWVAVKTAQDGFGFGLIKREKDAPQLLAAWYLMLQIAAKQDRKQRGKLWRDGRPLTADDLELMTGFPAKIFERAFEFFSQPKQGWLVAEQVGGDDLPLGDDQAPPPAHAPEKAKAAPAPESDAEWLATLGRNPAYAGLNIGAEFGKMQAWCGANRKQPSRRRFINWLNRAERPMQRQVTIPAAPKQTEPPNWRATLRKLYPDAADDIAWATLPQSVREQVTKSKAQPLRAAGAEDSTQGKS